MHRRGRWRIGNATRSLDPLRTIATGMPAQVASGKDVLFIARGVVVRLTRNLDKERGFVNGAIGTIET
eukprot:458925-Pyramimonas_sp.AAC.1